LYGKTQKLYIRQAQARVQISVVLVPDLSRSMLYEEAGLSKFNYTKLLFACLANLAFQQGDEVIVTNQKPFKQIDDGIRAIVALQAINLWSDHQQVYHQIWHTKHKKLVIYCSDFYEYDEEMLNWLQAIIGKGHEVIAFHITAEKEKQLNFNKNTVLVDLETNESLMLTKNLKEKATTQFSIQQKNLQSKLQKKGIHYFEMSMNYSVQKALNHYLTLRTKYKH